MKKNFIILHLIVLLAILILLGLTRPSFAYETAKVIRVIDGDTLKVEFQGKQESIRLIGIDTPESRINNKARHDSQKSGEDIRVITEMGKKATDFTKSLVQKGDRIRIEFDLQQRDKYGRLLGYGYINGDRMLNEEIIKSGYASIMTYPPNVKYQDRFQKAYREARENRRGLWKE